MTPEVKERIEQIRNGNVPEGYIKGKDGIHPCDWTAKKMGQWLKLAERPVVLKDDEVYQLVTVRRGFGGVGSRGYYLGKSVLVKNYFSVNAGDFIISKRQIAHGACGVVPEELDGAVVSNEYNVFIPQDGTNIQMFNLMMQLPHYKRLYYLMSDGVHIEKLLFKTQDWMRRSLAMPPLEEQKKIAEILTTQDKVIELEQQKIEEIKKEKKFFLSKMFPKKGQAVPEIRFKGFTDAWEQRKLGEMASLITKGTTPLNKSNTGEVNFVKIESIDEASGEISITQKITNEEHEGYLRRSQLKENDILFSIAGTLGRVTSVESSILPANTNQALAIIRLKNGDLQYVKTYLKGKAVSDYIKKNPTIGAQSNLSLEQVGSIEIALPSVQEQRIIGDYFRQIDNLITLHQRKLEEEKQKKKALMQLLLTGIVRV